MARLAGTPFALRLIALVALAVGMDATTAAQTARAPFDPVPFFSRIEAGQNWTPDMFDIPSNAVLTYSDSILQNKYVLAVTMHVDDIDSAGWKLRIFFEADRYGALRFHRALARRAPRPADARAFARLEGWIENVLRDKVGPRITTLDDEIVWPWTQDRTYFITLRRAHLTKGESLSLFLDRGPD